MTKKERAQMIVERLEQVYPEGICSLDYKKPHELMIAGRLSAQCTDARVNIVTKELFAKYKTIEDFANADVADIEEIIRPCGLYKTKARSIVAMCRQIMDNFGGEIPDTIEKLTTLAGIGRKTANLVMGDVFHKPAVVTDTHCIRICGRLGLTKNKEPAKVEEDLRRYFPLRDPLISVTALYCSDVNTARQGENAVASVPCLISAAAENDRRLLK